MADQLDSESAIHFARQLKAIPGFPWDDEVIKAHAEHLMRWCKGAIIGDRVWPAEAQAHWLVTEVQETWDKWLGTGGLRQVFREKFHPKNRPELRPLNMGEKPPIACSICNDNGIINTPHGHRYCECDQGVQMASDPVLGGRWLQCLDRVSLIPKGRRSEWQPTAEQQEEAFHAHQSRLAAAISNAEAVLADPGAPSERKEIAREVLFTYQGKSKAKQKNVRRP